MVVAVLIAALMIAGGVFLAATGRGWGLLAAGGASMAAVLVAGRLVSAIDASRRANQRCIDDFTAPFNERMQQMNVLLNLISEQQLISDRTKQVAYRTRDRDALRRAIHEEMTNGDWEAALILANDMATVFGYKGEASRLKREIEAKHSETLRKQVGESVAGIDRLIRTERWQEALAEAHKIAQAFPGDEQAHTLPQAVEERRQQHKRQLHESLLDANTRHDIDGAIEILRKLDPYLTPQEAESMQEMARNLFKEKLNALRTQLALAIKGHQWQEAQRVSDEIIRDFPNTRIAQEARDGMDVIRQRAEEANRAREAASASA
jgi:hypothetical protein